MATYSIIKYMARWNFKDHYGNLNIGYKAGTSARWKFITVTDPNEFAAMVDLLRNEQPVFYDDIHDHIQTSHEEYVGEGES